eukprot:352055-Chlamydomonas_euryale.AAC.2
MVSVDRVCQSGSGRVRRDGERSSVAANTAPTSSGCPQRFKVRCRVALNGERRTVPPPWG